MSRRLAPSAHDAQCRDPAYTRRLTSTTRRRRGRWRPHPRPCHARQANQHRIIRQSRSGVAGGRQRGPRRATTSVGPRAPEWRQLTPPHEVDVAVARPLIGSDTRSLSPRGNEVPTTKRQLMPTLPLQPKEDGWRPGLRTSTTVQATTPRRSNSNALRGAGAALHQQSLLCQPPTLRVQTSQRASAR